MIKIAPSTLSADFRKLGEEVSAVAASGADWLHFDCMDGHFVEHLTYGPLVVRALRGLTDMPFDVHLMIANPDAQIERYAEAGADHILFQREVEPRPIRLLQRVRDLGKKSGIVYNPATPLAEVEALLPWTDVVMLMSVEPGAGGQAFMSSALPRIELLRGLIDREGLSTVISIDGGVNAQTAPAIIAAGVDVLITGSWYFRHPGGYAAAAAELKAMG